MKQDIVMFGTYVGRITENNEFVKVCRKEHFFRKYAGFGISWDVLNDLRQKGIENIKIIFEDKQGIGKIYKTTVSAYLLHGRIVRNKKADFQRILELKYFTR